MIYFNNKMNEFNQKVYSIFERLDYYKITDSKLLKDDVIIEKETIQFVVRILNKENEELVSMYDVENFYEELINHYKLKGYLITNIKFDLEYSNNLYIYDGIIRLFDINEIERLYYKNL
jgi:hypothetical protein